MLLRRLLPLTVVVLLVGLPPVMARAATEARSVAAAERLVVDLVNQRRAEVGLPALTPRSDLHAHARAWSFTQAEQAAMGHNPNLGAVCCWTRLTENVAQAGGLRGADAASVAGRLVDLWRRSSTHDRNMTDADVDQFGVGIVVDDDGTAWGTTVFRACNGTSCSGGPQGPAGDTTSSWAPSPAPSPSPTRSSSPSPAPAPPPAPAPSPSPTPRPTPSPRPSPSPSPTPAPSPSPTASPTATPAPAPTPSATPSPLVVTSVEAASITPDADRRLLATIALLLAASGVGAAVVRGRR